MKGEQLVATLQSGDATKMFYGYSAAKDAYEEAADGDIITLSKGNYQDFTIEKAITLRGAGAFVEGESTVFKNLSVKTDNALIEGIRVTDYMTMKGDKLQFLRCFFNHFGSSNNATGVKVDAYTNDAYIGDCAIRSDNHSSFCVNAIYKNCTILGHGVNNPFDNSATYDNCIVRLLATSQSSMRRLGYFSNCILFYYDYIKLTTPNQFYNTIIYSTKKTAVDDGVLQLNCVLYQSSQEEYKNKFDSAQFPYFFSEEITLPDGTRFVCGVVDHKEWPAVPRVVESNIAKETDEAGHLKVQVKVSCER